MAKDDMEVVIYKILMYLYECMKRDVMPDLKKYGWHSELIDIPQQYWCKIIRVLVEKGLVKGFSVCPTKDGILIETKPPIEITYEGREFLRENSGMKKAKEVCGDAFEKSNFHKEIESRSRRRKKSKVYW